MFKKMSFLFRIKQVIQIGFDFNFLLIWVDSKLVKLSHGTDENDTEISKLKILFYYHK